jgi:branched-chain amino acid transport system ATP-binding protein
VTALLEVDELSVRFGGVAALDGVRMRVAEAGVTGLIGPNGAGKTTLIDAVTGFVRPDSGTIRFDGERIDGFAPHRRVRRGMVRTFQSLQLFEDLSVRENLLVASLPVGSLRDVVGMLRRPDPDALGRVDRALALLDLETAAERLPRELSHGRRNLVAVARALASGPRLLVLDEPAAGLDTDESLGLGRHLRAVAEAGVPVMLVDHDMGLVMGACDDLWAMDRGQVIAHGTPAEVRDHPVVVAAYLGDAVAHAPDVDGAHV